ncbi:DNA-binding response regulator [Leptothoe spongobia]|uniref:DNA-binding response regulator n=1 Tax=Leptothoe spongobia TAU-MAC 1115 TaxID=1967444 RepID=A0A947GJS9_9CYAN|nr:DNA-binding response regulator [Leptothoe spongobia]MBT9316228.1 DNA-binding response regulator [Leptothoe spongobia TAU-MAC 1115]
MAATSEQVKEILALRDRKVGPKQIARKLGLRPAEVKDIIHNQVTADPEKYARPRPLAPLKECLIDTEGFRHFFGGSKGLWNRFKQRDDLKGMSQIFVTRKDGPNYLMTNFLIDYWCLGVKNTIGPRKTKLGDYQLMIEATFTESMNDSYETISLEQAQAIIYGAVDYAKSLGLDPHPDFERAKKTLGPRMENLAQLEFGLDGQPHYINGPYDNADQILTTLRENVGEGNFKFTYISDGGGPDLLM